MMKPTLSLPVALLPLLELQRAVAESITEAGVSRSEERESPEVPRFQGLGGLISGRKHYMCPVPFLRLLL